MSLRRAKRGVSGPSATRLLHARSATSIAAPPEIPRSARDKLTMFIDEATIRVKAGDGGNGCIAFRREKFVPKGGPSGGDGGVGGSVWVVATSRLNTLYHLQHLREWKGDRGQHGMGSNCSGHDGEDVTIELPVGSVVRDKESGELIADLTSDGERIRVATG